MLELKIKNKYPQPELRFANTNTGETYDSIWGKLEQGLWKHIIVNNIIDNDQSGDLKRVKWQPIFPDIIPLYEGFSWNKNTNSIQEEKFYPKYHSANLDSFLKVAEAYFNSFKDKKIGVHLSGGLDSSIIIGLLKHFNIPFSLVGLTSRNFEFRTERVIQQKIAEWTDEVVLIDMDDVPNFSDIENIPPHQVPADGISGYLSAKIIAETFRKMNVDIVFTGMGGDNVFGDSILKENKDFFWQPYEYRIPWTEDYVYKPQGIELISFYADPNIINEIYSLRLGQKTDIPKIWAREFFKDFLPTELVIHTYSADFWGVWLTGLNEARPTIKHLFEQAHHFLENSHFEPKNIKPFIEQDFFNLTKPHFLQLASRISVAVWLNSLLNNK